MPKILSENWGSTLSGTFENSPTENENEGRRILESLGPDGLVEHCETTEVISLSALQAICQLAQTPTHLRAFKDSKIVPSLMRSLHSYCGNNQIFDYEYGYRWMEALTLAIGVSVLVEAQRLENYIEAQSDTVTPVQQASKYIVRILPKQSQGLTWVFGCSLSDGTCLPSIGGLTESELRFLVGRLWHGRKMLFELQSQMNTTGWPYVLLLLWHCACFIMDKKLIGRMRHLAFRNALRNVDPVDAQFILTVAANRDDLLQDSKSGGHTVDSEDTILILKTYIDRLTLGPHLHIHFLQYLISWLADIFDPQSHDDLTADLMLAHLTALWTAVNTQENPSYGMQALLMANYSFIGFASQAVAVITKQIDIAKGFDRQEMLVRTLHEMDLFDLVGRILLKMNLDVPESEVPSEVLISESFPAFDVLSRGLQHLAIVLRGSTAPRMKAQFTNNAHFLDWMKTRSHLRGLADLTKRRNSEFMRYTNHCQETWERLGELFDYPEIAAGKCANPSCCVASPKFFCARCEVARYCNINCQKQHWQLSTVEKSHYWCCYSKS